MLWGKPASNPSAIIRFLFKPLPSSQLWLIFNNHCDLLRKKSKIKSKTKKDRRVVFFSGRGWQQNEKGTTKVN